jgi:hypothetical protein
MENYKENSASIYFALKELLKNTKRNENNYIKKKYIKQNQFSNKTENIFANVKLGV